MLIGWKITNNDGLFLFIKFDNLTLKIVGVSHKVLVIFVIPKRPKQIYQQQNIIKKKTEVKSIFSKNPITFQFKQNIYRYSINNFATIIEFDNL